MNERIAMAACVLALLVVVLSAPSARAADPDNGRRIAERWCASCHLVAEGQKRANADVASFAAIAEMPNFDAPRLAFFLLGPHPKMPDMALSRSEAQDIAAYIGTLRK